MNKKRKKKKYISPRISTLSSRIARVVCEIGGPDFGTCIGGSGTPTCSDPS